MGTQVTQVILKVHNLALGVATFNHWPGPVLKNSCSVGRFAIGILSSSGDVEDHFLFQGRAYFHSGPEFFGGVAID